MDIVEIIDDLEREFASSRNFLWSKKTLVNMDKCASLIAELKANLPSAIQEASYILSKKQQILNNAESEAKKMIAEAEFRAGQLVGASEITRKSEIRAKEIINKASRKSDELYQITKENVDKMLGSVENYLNQNIDIVRRNRDELNRTVLGLKSPEDDTEN